MSERKGSEKRALLKAETVTPDGTILGFAYQPSAPAPATVQILVRGAIVAEARATLFRPDLLAAGLSHGHHGFAARLRKPLKPGLFKPALQCGDVHVACALTAPAQVSPTPISVETLLEPPSRWSVTDFLAHPGCLPWAAYLSDMGDERFIDAAFRFALHRWPSKPETTVHARALSRGHVSAEAFVVQLLRSRERLDFEEGLMSPFDAEFGF